MSSRGVILLGSARAEVDTSEFCGDRVTLVLGGVNVSNLSGLGDGQLDGTRQRDLQPSTTDSFEKLTVKFWVLGNEITTY